MCWDWKGFVTHRDIKLYCKPASNASTLPNVPPDVLRPGNIFSAGSLLSNLSTNKSQKKGQLCSTMGGESPTRLWRHTGLPRGPRITNSPSHPAKAATPLLLLPYLGIKFQMSDFQATDASGCGCCAGVCTPASRGREEMGGGEKSRRRKKKEQMLNYGCRGARARLQLPRSQRVNHPWYGSNASVH